MRRFHLSPDPRPIPTVWVGQAGRLILARGGSGSRDRGHKLPLHRSSQSWWPAASDAFYRKLRLQLASTPTLTYGARMKSIILERSQLATLQGIPQRGCLLVASRPEIDVNFTEAALLSLRAQPGGPELFPTGTWTRPSKKPTWPRLGHESSFDPPGRSWLHVSWYKM